ncbi:hypothetical protein PRZ48_000069 [Zasmidium cellare]|uniref:Uncharacterized protein n=1 Tax=Zasmidium cellare TaxID=395010 RepID=A0ABR0EY82_ZASCE|nr:hypothetical protein PRZ48_000069 [Zasmidium cellare]
METGKSLSEPYEEVPKSSDGAASSATVVVAEQDGHVPISSPQPKIDEASGNNQVVLPAGLFDQLQKATQAHIEMRDCEREADATAQHLERRLDFLDEQISTIQRDLAEARPDVMKPKSESCIDMQEGLQKCLREKEKIFGLLEKIEEYLHEDHENYRERTEGFFEMWRKISYLADEED